MTLDRAIVFLAQQTSRTFPNLLASPVKLKLALVNFGDSPESDPAFPTDSQQAQEAAEVDGQNAERASAIYQDLSPAQIETFCRAVQATFPPSPDVTPKDLAAVL